MVALFLPNLVPAGRLEHRRGTFPKQTRRIHGRTAKHRGVGVNLTVARLILAASNACKSLGLVAGACALAFGLGRSQKVRLREGRVA
jgi:hypothetical protein